MQALSGGSFLAALGNADGITRAASRSALVALLVGMALSLVCALLAAHCRRRYLAGLGNAEGHLRRLRWAFWGSVFFAAAALAALAAASVR